LIQVNWSKLKSYIEKGLRLARKLGEGILKTILKILTMLVLGLLATYKGLSRFAKNRHKGIWIILLINLLVFGSIFALKREKMYRERLERFQDDQEKCGELLNDYEELYKQVEEIESELKTQTSKSPKATSSTVENWRYLVVKYFPPEQVENALAIMACESGGNPKAINEDDAKITGYPSCGLFQINGPTNWEWDNPEKNVDRAVTKFYERGWQPWRNCAIKLGLI